MKMSLHERGFALAGVFIGAAIGLLIPTGKKDSLGQTVTEQYKTIEYCSNLGYNWKEETDYREEEHSPGVTNVEYFTKIKCDWHRPITELSPRQIRTLVQDNCTNLYRENEQDDGFPYGIETYDCWELADKVRPN